MQGPPCLVCWLNACFSIAWIVMQKIWLRVPSILIICFELYPDKIMFLFYFHSNIYCSPQNVYGDQDIPSIRPSFRAPFRVCVSLSFTLWNTSTSIIFIIGMHVPEDYVITLCMLLDKGQVAESKIKKMGTIIMIILLNATSPTKSLGINQQDLSNLCQNWTPWAFVCATVLI